MSDPIPTRDEDDLLAAELAFGLLDANERQAVEARLANDRTLADAYRRWQDRAATLALGAEENPRPSIWSAIEARLPANDMSPVVASPASVRWWQASTAVAAAAAIVLAIVSVRGPLLPPPAPVIVRAQAAAPLVAVLTGTPGKGIVTVSYDRTQRSPTVGADRYRHRGPLRRIMGDPRRPVAAVSRRHRGRVAGMDARAGRRRTGDHARRDARHLGRAPRRVADGSANGPGHPQRKGRGGLGARHPFASVRVSCAPSSRDRP